jgi:peptidoglycan/LPS O-acetylase OafA/YrhL
MKWIDTFVEDGHLTNRGADAIGSVGVALIAGTAYFFEDWSGFWFWSLALTGGALGYVGAYGGLAKKMGFSAPFSSDPLGWRSAKKTYDEEQPKKDKSSY